VSGTPTDPSTARADGGTPVDPAGRGDADADADAAGDGDGDGAGNAGGNRDGTEPVVSLADVHRTYDVGGTVAALAGVSLSLAPGSYTAVMGPSGSGKSTLLNLVGGLDTPTRGRVVVDGHDLAAASEDDRAAVRGSEVGFVFQTFNLMPRLTAVENVALPLVFEGVAPARRRARARELLADVGLADRADHLPSELSGGQRQRVAIARALAAEPALLLADEPTGNVDTDTGDRIMALFDDLHAAGNTILLVTHERRIAERADRIVHFLDGEVEGVERPGDGDADIDGDGDGTPASTLGEGGG
jgi:putative ABC transport system ATP-binding protein